MFLHTRVEFVKWTYKAISNWEMDVSERSGYVTCVGPDYISIKLYGHEPDLDEWENELIWVAEDCLFGERLDAFLKLNEEQRTAFFQGFLAAMVKE